MTQTRRIVCEYCATSNPWNENTCLACGGPLTPPKIDLKPIVTTVNDGGGTQQPKSQDLKDATEKADGIYFTVLNTYAIAWRTVGEAISIALCGMILGFLGGVTGVIFPGILGAILIGLVVGFTRKPFIIVLISAPAGLFLGLGLGILIWILGGEPQIMIYLGMVFAIIGALLGGRRNLPFRQRNCWEKTRPLLGAMGGVASGFLGVILGWGISVGFQGLQSI